MRKAETDVTVQVLPQSPRLAGCPRGGSLSIPIVLPLTSEVRCPGTEAAPVPLTPPYTPDAGSHLSHPKMESVSRSVSPDHFKIIIHSTEGHKAGSRPCVVNTWVTIYILICQTFFHFVYCHGPLRGTRRHSSRAAQVRATVCVGDALEGEGDAS